ncbi:MAG: dienelactone hydrolase family protein [Roseiarcus sp.]
MADSHRNAEGCPPARCVPASAYLALAVGVALIQAPPAWADERVQFRSLDGKLALTALLDRPPQVAPAPAVVMLHGCSGLGASKGPFAIYRDWRDFLGDKGYVTLMVDSAASRGFGQTCTTTVKDQTERMWAERPSDAYAALAFLQSQPFVIADAIALIGWSQGGGVVLETIPAHSLGRPNPPPAHDFAAAIAFYPGLCADRLQAAHLDAPAQSWTTSIPLLVLQGELDNWTPAKPCEAFLRGAQARDAPVTFQIYPGAYHGFDAPDIPVHTVESYRRDDWAPIEGTNEAARADARSRALQFLAEHLRMKAAR